MGTRSAWTVLLACVVVLVWTDASAGVGKVVISEVFGGGNQLDTYHADYVVLFNAGDAAVSLNGWTLQVSEPVDTSLWRVVPLSGTIDPGRWMLVQTSIPGGSGDPLPTPDGVGMFPLATIEPSGGRVALVDQSGASPLPSGFCARFEPGVVDYLGWGGESFCAEGGIPAFGVQPGESVVRLGDGCTDSDNNQFDFSGGEPRPRSSATPPAIITGSAFPQAVAPGSGSTLRVAVGNSVCGGAGLSVSHVRADLTSIGGSAATAMNPVGGGVWSVAATVDVSVPGGPKLIPVEVELADATVYGGFIRVDVVALNDGCAGARFLPESVLPIIDEVDISSASDDPVNVTCDINASASRGVWYRVIPSEDCRLTVQELSASNDVVVTVFTGSCGSLAQVICRDDGFTDEMNVDVVGGTEYLVLVSQWDASSTPTEPIRVFVNCQIPPEPPTNDPCENASSSPIASPTLAFDTQVVGTLLSATRTGASGCAIGGVDTYHSFTPAVSAEYTLETCATTGTLDTALSIHRGCGASAFNELAGACSDDACGAHARIERVLLEGGVEYVVRVATGAGSVEGGDYVVRAVAEPPANENCAGSTPVAPFADGVSVTVGSNALADPVADPNAPSSVCADAARDVFYSFTIPDQPAGVNTWTFQTSGETSVLEVLDGPVCGMGTASLACSVAGGGEGENPMVRLDLPAGFAGSVRVASAGSEPGGMLELQIAGPVGNDTCAAATPIPGDGVTGLLASTSGAADGVDGQPVSCAPASHTKDVWFTFTPTRSGVGSWDLTTCGSSVDTSIEVFTSCGSGSIACNDDRACVGGFSGGTPGASGVSVTLAQGTAYLVRVATPAPGGLVALNVFPTPPVNDSACAAVDASGRGWVIDIVEEPWHARDDVDVGCNEGSSSATVNGVWYTYQATRGVRLAVRERSDNDAVVAVFDGPSCEQLTERRCEDALLSDGLVVDMADGERLWFLVGMFQGPGAETSYDVEIRELSPPFNDSACSAWTVASFPRVEVWDGRDAGDDNDVPCDLRVGQPGVRGVWYRIVPPAGGLLGVEELSGNETVVTLYEGPACSTLVEMSCSDQNPAGFAVEAGGSYWGLVTSRREEPVEPYVTSFTFEPNTGACCAGAVCTIVTQSECESSGGVYAGDFVSCEGGPQAEAEGGVVPDGSNDGTPGVVELELEVSGVGTVQTLEVEIGLVHSYAGDVAIRLESPSGVRATLLENAGRDPALGCAGDIGVDSFFDGTYTVSDTGGSTFNQVAVDVGAFGLVPGGVYRASSCGGSAVDLAGVFSGAGADGTWKLIVEDHAEQDVGEVRRWGLAINGGLGPACGDACAGDTDGDAVTSVGDILNFLSAWSLREPLGDTNSDGIFSVGDILDYLTAWSRGCP